MKTAEEVFNRIWDIDYNLFKKGFPVTSKYKGRPITVQITECYLYLEWEDEIIEINNDDYVVTPICKDSIWLSKIDDTNDIFYGEIDTKIPKDIETKLKDLRKYLKDVEYTLIDAYFNSMNYSSSKQTNLKNYLQALKDLEKKKEEKAIEKHFKINSSYTAVFNDKSDIVKIGCQNIPKSVIIELATLL